MLPQATALSFPFTVREIVKLGLTGGRSGALAGEDERLPERALARVDLDGFAGRFYQELSGGEQQRVQLARVLCQVWAPVLDGEPRYLFLDEPVSSLDIKHQLIIMNIARDFAQAGRRRGRHPARPQPDGDVRRPRSSSCIAAGSPPPARRRKC